MQRSIDGLNVNWKFYCNLFQECKGEELPDLLNIGSCSQLYIDYIYCSQLKYNLIFTNHVYKIPVICNVDSIHLCDFR